MERSAEPDATGGTIGPLVTRRQADPCRPGLRRFFGATFSRLLRNLYLKSDCSVNPEDLSHRLAVEKETQRHKQQGGDPSGPAHNN